MGKINSFDELNEIFMDKYTNINNNIQLPTTSYMHHRNRGHLAGIYWSHVHTYNGTSSGITHTQPSHPISVGALLDKCEDCKYRMWCRILDRKILDDLSLNPTCQTYWLRPYQASPSVCAKIPPLFSRSKLPPPSL